VSDEFLTDLRELARKPRPAATVGGKAANLARLLGEGARVPPGFAIHATALAGVLGGRDEAGAARLDEAIACAAAGLRAPLVVRSSASIEDTGETAAPGVFLSLRDIAHGTALAEAVRAVWESARAPTADGFLRARGVAADTLHMAVVVQEQASGTHSGTIYTRPPGRPSANTALLEARSTGQSAGAAAPREPRAARHHAVEVDRESGAVVSDSPDFPLSPTDIADITRAAIAAERAIAADLGADVEWVLDDGGAWIVQARPLLRALQEGEDRTPPSELFRFSRAAPNQVWSWDATHNPEPLSPAQAGLVERVDAARLAPFRMQVVGGYLYATAAHSEERPDIPARAEELRALFDGEIRPQIERALTSVEGSTPPNLEASLRAYDGVYRVYASVLGPLLAGARRALPELLHTELGDERSDAIAVELLAVPTPSALESLLRRTAAGEISFGDLLEVVGPLSPVWDVAEATYGEAPDVLERALARHRAARAIADSTALQAAVRSRLPHAAAQLFDQRLSLAQVAGEIGEEDDLLFGRAQYAVRRALLACAERWELCAAGDVFYAPLDHTLDCARRDQPPSRARFQRAVERGRAAQRAQRALAMPLAFRGGRPLATHRRVGSRSDCWQGRGMGGRIHGTVIRVDDLSREIDLPADAVLVALTVTPAMTLLITGVACVVTEHGGLLDHGAALARELGVPCVVGCTGVWADLDTGDRVWVDGQAGVVARVLNRAQ